MAINNLQHAKEHIKCAQTKLTIGEDGKCQNFLSWEEKPKEVEKG